MEIASIGSFVQYPNGKLTFRVNSHQKQKNKQYLIFLYHIHNQKSNIKQIKVDQANEQLKNLNGAKISQKKYREVVYIRGKPLTIASDPVSCEYYNMVKYMFARIKQKADFSFL